MQFYQYRKEFDDETACEIEIGIGSWSVPFKVRFEKYPTWFTPQIKKEALDEAYNEAALALVGDSEIIEAGD